MKRQRLPPGWDEKSIRELAEYYDNQTEDEALAEAEAAFSDPNCTVMVVPTELVPAIHRLLAKRAAARRRAAKSNVPVKKRKRA